jgi:hypothetical protein
MRVCPADRIGYSSERIPVSAAMAARGPGASGRSAAGSASPCQGEGRGFESRRPLGGAGSRLACRRSARLFGTGPAPRGSACGGMAEWLRQGPAKPCTRVRFPLPPRGRLAQRESASLTRKRSLVQSQYRPPDLPARTPHCGASGRTARGTIGHPSGASSSVSESRLVRAAARTKRARTDAPRTRADVARTRVLLTCQVKVSLPA